MAETELVSVRGESDGELQHSMIKSDSIVRKEESSDKDETCGLRCGSYGIASCHCLQPLANAKWALLLTCLANMMQQIVLNGILGVTISTLEKRFELRSTESGLIASTGDFGRGITMFLVMFLSSRADKPRVMGWGLLIGGVATLLFALPHFTAPEYQPVVGDVLNYCGNVTEPDCSQSAIRNYLNWFIAMFILIGAGTCPVVVHGITYLDENVSRKDSALYSGIYMAIGGLGPTIGYIFGGMTLELYTYPREDHSDLNIDSSSYSWVGAWWISYLVAGALMILNAIPMLLLPKDLPGAKKHRKHRNTETQKGHLQSTEENDERRTALGIFSDIAILLQNTPYVFLTIGMAMNNGFIYGFSTFAAKYLETLFGLTPFHSSFLYGVLAVFACFGAQICSGMAIRKFNLQVPGIIKLIIVTAVISVLCSFGFLVHCYDIDFAGGTVPYGNGSEPFSVLSSCNSNCSCTTDRYEPVCANGVTYFSPCFAGCEVKLNDTTYTDCSCVFNNMSHVDRSAIVSSEACDWKWCSLVIPFVFILFLCFFSSIFTMTPSMQVTLRCVPFNKRDLAMSFQAAFSRLVGIIPGRLLVGYVLDKACVSSSTECGERGSCKVYNKWEVAKNNTILLISQTVLCAVAYAIVYITYKPAGESSADNSKTESNEADENTEEVTWMFKGPGNDFNKADLKT